MITYRKACAAVASILMMLAAESIAQPGDDKGLKDYYKDYFPIGVAVSPRALQNEEGELILKQFSSMTPENAMKMGPIHPEENRYYWDDADKIIDFASFTTSHA